MKKQNLLAIVATVAVVANLLVPGLAFGQSQQGGTQQVNCGQRYMHIFDDGNVQAGQNINFSFNEISVSTGVQYTFGEKIGDMNQRSYQNDGSSALPPNSFVYVEDNTLDCETKTNWDITVSATDFTGPNGTIPAAGLKLATTGNVTGWGNYDTDGNGSKDATIPWEPGMSTQYLKAVAPSETGIVVPATLANYDDSTIATASFDSAGIVLDGTGGIILQNYSGVDYTPGFWGVGTAFRLAVPGNTPAGQYTSTITYTFNPAIVP
ncbi:hypothetical protein KBB06_04100 [Candidatus Gracilibacteria bacterium]|nr:hypothetical protein [Candidatus Gracilibacteria bacterium]